jgi:hypothetical protein
MLYIKDFLQKDLTGIADKLRAKNVNYEQT